MFTLMQLNVGTLDQTALNHFELFCICSLPTLGIERENSYTDYANYIV